MFSIWTEFGFKIEFGLFRAMGLFVVFKLLRGIIGGGGGVGNLLELIFALVPVYTPSLLFSDFFVVFDTIMDSDKSLKLS